MDISYIVNPIVTSGVVAVVCSVTMVWLVVVNRAAITGALATLRKKLFTRSGFFWTVNIIFMAVSVIHAGVFFGITGNGHDIPGVAQYLGFAVSFFLDLVTIILMQALLEAKYRSDELRARQFLLFITICCATSTFANLAISLNDFDATVLLPNAPEWIQVLAPYVLASFPLFVILMSIAAEMIVNVRPLDSLNEDEYESDEKKRVKLMQIRNDYLQRQADEELRALTIRGQMQINKRMRAGRLPSSFRWFWEKAIDIDAVIAGVSAQLKATYEPQMESLKQQLEDLKSTPIIIQESTPDDVVEVHQTVVFEDTAADVSSTPEQLPEWSVPAAQTVDQKSTSPVHQSVNNTGDAAKQIRKILKKKPDTGPTELAERTGCTKSYASRVKADWRKEQIPATNGHSRDTQPLDSFVELEV